MVRYYLHVVAGSVTEMDPRGIDLANDAEAITQVTAAARELRAEFGEDDWTGWSLHVLDASGRCVLDLALEPLSALT
jgi:hypothetical protein